VLFVTLVRRSERVGDRDDTHTRVREGAEGGFGEVECPSTTAAVGTPVHNFDGDRPPAAAVTLALDAVVAAAVGPVVPYVGVTVARSREVLVVGELVWVIPIARRGNIWSSVVGGLPGASTSASSSASTALALAAISAVI